MLTEQLIARHFGASVRIVTDGDAGIAVLPLRPAVEAENPVS